MAAVARQFVIIDQHHEFLDCGLDSWVSRDF
jgi:hypothetical protein